MFRRRFSRLAHLWRRRVPARARLLVIGTDTHGAVWSPQWGYPRAVGVGIAACGQRKAESLGTARAAAARSHASCRHVSAAFNPN